MNILEKKVSQLITLDEECPVCKNNLSAKIGDIFRIIFCNHCKTYGRISEKSSGECCESPSVRNVRYKTSGTAIQIRKQCTTCGQMPGSAIGGFSPLEKEKLPFADIEKRDARDAIYNDLRRKVNKWTEENRLKAREEQNAEWWASYTTYLESKIWKEKARMVMKRDNHLCQSCLIVNASQVHHKSYQFVDFKGGEPAFDLEAICTPCHDKLHKKKEEEA